MKPHRGDLNVHVRQATFLRALRTIPNLTIHEGSFLSNRTRLPRYPVTDPPQMVEVLKTEEKGSDVNLASYMLLDAFKDLYDHAVVISADSDLAFPVEAVQTEFGKRVGVFRPPKRHSEKLKLVATYYRPIYRRTLKNSQFPPSMTDAAGTFTKPRDW